MIKNPESFPGATQRSSVHAVVKDFCSALPGLLLGLLLVLRGSEAGAMVYIDIDAPSARRLPIVIEDFEGDRTAPSLTETVRGDLDMSALFQIIGERGEKGDAKFWLSAGGETLVRGKVSLEGGTLALEGYLYDITRGETLLSRRYRGRAEDVRPIAHRFSDDIIEALTGKKGVFGTRIAFVSKKGGNKELYMMDFDGRNVRPLTRNGSINLSPRWSPDGRRIIFTSFKEGTAALYLKDLTTYAEERLIAGAEMTTGGAWSPDGRQVVFTLSKGGDSDLFTVEVGSRTLKRLTSGWGLDVSPAWAPAGRAIAYVSDRSGNPNVFVTSGKDDNGVRLTFDGKYNTSPAWSPDGRRIAYSSLQNEGFRIYIMNADGTENRQFSFGPGNDEDPVWSPDGRFIAFTSTREGRKSIYIKSIDGSKTIRLEGTGGSDMNPSWSPFLTN